MKIKGFVFVTIMALGLNNANAQKFKGQSNFTVGTSMSLAGLIINVVKDVVNTTTNVTFKTYPAFNAMYDYGIADNFSIGGAFYYQSWTLNYKGYTNSTGDTVLGDFKDKISRMNFGIRPLFHFGQSDDVDLYVGARLSYTQWGYNTNSNNGKSSGDVFGGNPIKFQALFGARYFFNESIGFNLELAVGPTYYAMFGLNFKFGGM